ncbi:MAG: HD-GYP domain-containing protein [Oscillospiraceae bacterium]
MKRILIADSSKIHLAIAKQMLSAEYITDWTMSGDETLRYLTKIRPDMILIDLNLSDINGIELLKKIHNNSDYRQIPVIMLSSSLSREIEIQCIENGAVDYISKPYIKKIFLGRIARIFELEDYRKNLESVLKSKTRQIEHMQNKIILSFANIIENRDDSTGHHVKRTSEFVKAIVYAMKDRGYYSDILTNQYIESICQSAPLHDIGKISISDTILCKPGRLTAEEFEIMKSHTTEGGRILNETLTGIEGENYLIMARDMAMYHHEKWNGTGYPQGLSGHDIPLCARIMAVADVFDALISKRCYKDAMPMDKAFSIIEEAKAVHFEPCIVDTFLDIKYQIKEISRV